MAWTAKRYIGSHTNGTSMVITERKAGERHACITSFNDLSYGWWPHGERGFAAKSYEEARNAADKYLETGKVPKRKKAVTLEGEAD